MIGVHLKNRAENIIVLIGHNKGGDFVFRDGSHKEISGIVEACAIAAKICIFLSCYSKQYLDSDNDAVGVIHALTFLEALSIASKFKARLASQPSERHSVYTIAKYLGKEEVSAKRHSRVRFLVLKGSGTAAALTGVAILIAFLDDEDDKKEWSRPWHWREQT